MLSDTLYRVDSKYGSIHYFKNDYWFTINGSSKIFEEDLILRYLKSVLKRSKFVLDIGAHAGSHTIVYKHINKDLQIFAFEPQKRMFELLSFNVASSNLEDVKLFNFAVGHKVGDASLDTKIHELNRDLEISYDPNITSNLGGVGLGLGGEMVRMVSIDSLQLEECDFIKIDVEGAENLVILGARETIIRFKPVIFFESNHTKISPQTLEKLSLGSDIPDTKQMLYQLGYSQILQVDSMNYLAKFSRDIWPRTVYLHLMSYKRKLAIRSRIKKLFRAFSSVRRIDAGEVAHHQAGK